MNDTQREKKNILICNPVELVRKRMNRLAEDGVLLDDNGWFSLVRFLKRAAHSHDIADIYEVEEFLKEQKMEKRGRKQGKHRSLRLLPCLS